MKIKESDNLEKLAEAANKPAGKVAERIIEELLQRGIIEDDPCLWGQSLEDIYCRDVAVSEMLQVLHAAGIEDIKSGCFDALLDLVVMGDGDCPECGGDMEVTDFEERIVAGDGYLTPYEYEPIWEEKTCSNCGYVESNER